MTNLILVLPILGIRLPKTKNRMESLEAILAGIREERMIEIKTIDVRSLARIADLSQDLIEMNVFGAKAQCETMQEETIEISAKVTETMIANEKEANHQATTRDKIGV